MKMLSFPNQNIINTICEIFEVRPDEISDIEPQKNGMTNHSFTFIVHNTKYIIRISGEGTDKLINRKQEYEVYQTIKDLNICDDIFYINPENGCKVSKYIPNAIVCNPFSTTDLKLCMKKLRDFHNLGIQVKHTFDLWGQIDFYENLLSPNRAKHPDYFDIKESVLSLREYIQKYTTVNCLSHIDAIYDNFIFDDENNTYLIDWEYSGMQDPHIDIAMFCVYAMYEKNDIDKLIDIYFSNSCPKEIRLKIYCYIASCGLLWSNWCDYKSTLGVDFGEYASRQYRYAGEYVQYVLKEIKL